MILLPSLCGEVLRYDKIAEVTKNFIKTHFKIHNFMV